MHLTRSRPANAATMTLTDLADHYGTDKGVAHLNTHHYTRVYEQLLRPARHAPLRILEIGLLHPDTQRVLRADGTSIFAHAPSLDMWADYLPNAEIVGLDIHDFSGYQRERVTVLRADQGDRASLQQAVRPILGRGFDIIIDDGSHASHHQQITLGALFPALVPGGVYIIEDLHWQPPELEQPILKTRPLLQMLAATGSLAGVPTALTREECHLLEREARSIAFFDSMDRTADVFQTRDTLALIERLRR